MDNGKNYKRESMRIRLSVKNQMKSAITIEDSARFYNSKGCEKDGTK